MPASQGAHTRAVISPGVKRLALHNYEISAAAAAGIRQNEYCTDLLKNLKNRGPIPVDPSQQPAADRSLTAMHGLTSL
jgi:hypothetical protein